jgi:hypothetical protein
MLAHAAQRARYVADQLADRPAALGLIVERRTVQHSIYQTRVTQSSRRDQVNAQPGTIIVTISPTWTDVVQAAGALLVPVVVAGLAYVLTRNQSRSQELVRARLEYYKLLAPDLNRLMCYITFIGGWRDDSPDVIIALKRRLDANFYCAAPLFSPGVLDAYNDLMELSFSTFGPCGTDARIKSNAFRRRQSWRGEGESAWRQEWDNYFILQDTERIAGESLMKYRRTYDSLLAAAVRDLDITRARSEYTTNVVKLNAHVPRIEDILGGSS